MIETLAKPFVPHGEQVTWWLLAKERGAGADRIARAAFHRVSSPRLKRACAIPFLGTMNDEVGRALDHCFGEGDRTDG